MRTLTLMFGLIAAFTLAAQDTSPRIAMLVPDRIIETTARGHRLFSDLDTLKKTLQDKINAKRAEIQRLTGQLQSPSVSDAGKETIQKQLRDLDFEEKKLQDDSQMEFQRSQQKVVTQFQQELSPLVEELAKEQKLQLVLTYQPGLVAFADQNWILAFTDEVGRRYDASTRPAPRSRPPRPSPAPRQRPPRPNPPRPSPVRPSPPPPPPEAGTAAGRKSRPPGRLFRLPEDPATCCRWSRSRHPRAGCPPGPRGWPPPASPSPVRVPTAAGRCGRPAPGGGGRRRG